MYVPPTQVYLLRDWTNKIQQIVSSVVFAPRWIFYFIYKICFCMASWSMRWERRRCFNEVSLVPYCQNNIYIYIIRIVYTQPNTRVSPICVCLLRINNNDHQISYISMLSMLELEGERKTQTFLTTQHKHCICTDTQWTIILYLYINEKRKNSSNNNKYIKFNDQMN